MSLKHAERDRTAHQRYSGTFSVTGPSSNQTIGNQYATRDLNITTWPSQHVDTEWSQTSHSRPAPPLPPKIIYIAVALLDFQPNAVDELCFKAGDQIELTQGKNPSKDGWLKGRIKGGSGEEGLVPKAYVEIRSDEGLSQ
ncbi:hypothetical protein DPV78_001959 [Talaromyces pinophilus]|nr:hypothetical protein DPV78_001959 [Talaromyces pinophilus]